MHLFNNQIQIELKEEFKIQEEKMRSNTEISQY